MRRGTISLTIVNTNNKEETLYDIGIGTNLWELLDEGQIQEEFFFWVMTDYNYTQEYTDWLYKTNRDLA